jgi:hypothetical protein
MYLQATKCVRWWDLTMVFFLFHKFLSKPFRWGHWLPAHIQFKWEMKQALLNLTFLQLLSNLIRHLSKVSSCEFLTNQMIILITLESIIAWLNCSDAFYTFSRNVSISILVFIGVITFSLFECCSFLEIKVDFLIEVYLLLLFLL